VGTVKYVYIEQHYRGRNERVIGPLEPYQAQREERLHKQQHARCHITGCVVKVLDELPDWAREMEEGE
jgi:hypothetical protein